MKKVCTFSWSYTRKELWYNDITNEFLIDEYHYGVIDDEEHFDGTSQIDTLTALKMMIEKNKLRSVLMYQDELNLSRDLDTVLADLKANGMVYDYAFLLFAFASMFVCFILYICKFNYEMIKIRRTENEK